MRVAVVGSGLSGLATARALIRRGLKPVVIDAGEMMAAPLDEIVHRMRGQSPVEWDRRDVERIRHNATVRRSGIPKKLVFGSDYVYASHHPLTRLTGAGLKASMTLAKGGFGNAWGAALLPADPADLGDDWPIPAADLERNYRRVMSWLPLSAGKDRLQQHFPTYCDRPRPLELPVQALSLMQDLSHTDESRVSYGLARLAVHTTGERACRSCGLCLWGCVYGSIFNPADDIDGLSRAGLIDYRGSYVVESLAESDRVVRISAQRLGMSEREELVFDRVFLAAGAISSTRIMLQSLEAYGEPVALIDSQKFLLPLFRIRASPYSVTDTHSLAALFLEIKVPELAGNWMHMQISAVSDFLLRRFGADSNRYVNALMRPLFARTLVAWCSLHSAHSAALETRLVRSNGGVPGLEMTPVRLDRASQSVRVALHGLAREARSFRSWVVPSLVKMSSPGASNHIGGSFPMRREPRSRFDTDVLGRPSGFRAVHLVDAASMPSIPATTIALLMMANADRIATEAPI